MSVILMSESQKQNINNISYNLTEEDVKKIEKVAVNLLDIRLLEVLPQLELSMLEELDTTEKIILLREYSKSEEQRKREAEEAISFEECLKKAGLTIDDLQN